MRNKNGFTLIELLGVIVILAIVALIITPVILNIVDETKKKAFENSAYGIIKAGEVTYADDLLMLGEVSTTAFTYVNGTEMSNPGGKTLGYKGEKPKSGNVILNSDGDIALAIHNGVFCAEKDFDEDVVTLSDKTKAECYILFNADLSGASVPELSLNMIPIKWDGTKWIKANVNNLIGDYQWYDYSKQEWANVALVSQSSRDGYFDAAEGAEVNEADVMAYLVWVPRYKYKLFNVGATAMSAQEIEIVFEDKTVSKSGGTTNGTYLTHPAFTFGNEEVNGFWVGKYETTGSAATPTIKPNTPSITNQNGSSAFSISQKFNNTLTYGLASDDDAHMVKSMEWGATAYLSQSDYGKYGNPIYTGGAGLEKEVYVNNVNSAVTGNGPAVTGCAGNSVTAAMVRALVCPTGNEYYTTKGVKASTTGNVYGIYDMSGGSWERVMHATYDSGVSTLMVASSGFAQSTIDSMGMEKYINKYAYGTTMDDQTAYNRRQLGDGTGEVRGWNGDVARFSYSTNPWSSRGGYHVGDVGIFTFSYSTTAATPESSFRVAVITKLPENPPIQSGLIFSLEGKDFTNSPATTSWTDRSGSGNNAIPTNFTHTISSGSDGAGGVVFDGTNDYAITPGITINTEMTWEVVLKSSVAKDMFVIDQRTGGVGVQPIYMYSTGAMQFFDSGTATSLSVPVNTFKFDGLPHHIVCVGTATSKKVYYDTQLVASISTGITPNVATPIYIGTRHSLTGFMGGTIIQARVYNRALTEAEIIQNYKTSY